jgi:DHA1 family tetracycline resistance protein-like MFS transporter
VLPETVSKENRRSFDIKRANPLSAFRAIGSLPGQSPMLLIIFVFSVAHFVYPAIWAYFGKEKFGWDPTMIGLSLAAFGISMAVVQAVLIRPILRILGDRKTVLAGFIVDIVGMLLVVFVDNGWMVLALTPVMALGSISGRRSKASCPAPPPTTSKANCKASSNPSTRSAWRFRH